MFFQPSQVALGFQVLVAATASVPTVNIEKTCRESERAIVNIFGSGTAVTFENCMSQEKAAREQIVKDWQTFSIASRQHCINVTGYMPSYVEWLTCLEMEKFLKETRKSNQSGR
jgi:hypothetical protein